MTLNRNLLSEAVRYSLTTGAVGLLSLASAPAFAQDTSTTTDASKTKTLEKVEVTGSRIKRVDQEGPQPITILKRADLEVSGNISVADVLRSTTFNSFGSLQQTSGNTARSLSSFGALGISLPAADTLCIGVRSALTGFIINTPANIVPQHRA
jgi:iron complex outermembrane receptor protein